MPITFERAQRNFESCVEQARRSAITLQPHGLVATPKEERAAVQAALEIMEEAATTSSERQQVANARGRLNEFRGAPLGPLQAGMDALHMNGRKNRLKRSMVKSLGRG